MSENSAEMNTVQGKEKIVWDIVGIERSHSSETSLPLRVENVSHGFQIIMSPIIYMVPPNILRGSGPPHCHLCLLPSITYDPQTPVWPRLVS